MTEASGFSKLLVIYQTPQCHMPGNTFTTVKTSNLKMNTINYSYWLILYFLYSLLFYCCDTLMLYFPHFISYFMGSLSTTMLTCFSLSYVSFILSQQAQVKLLGIYKTAMLICPVSCCSASSLSIRMPACLSMLSIIPPWHVFPTFTYHKCHLSYIHGVQKWAVFKLFQTKVSKWDYTIQVSVPLFKGISHIHILSMGSVSFPVSFHVSDNKGCRFISGYILSLHICHDLYTSLKLSDQINEN